MSELANHRATVPYDPELRCGRNTVEIIEAEPQRPQFCGEPDQSRNKLGKELGRLPARGIDSFVVSDCLINPHILAEKGSCQTFATLDPAALAAPSIEQLR